MRQGEVSFRIRQNKARRTKADHDIAALILRRVTPQTGAFQLLILFQRCHELACRNFEATLPDARCRYNHLTALVDGWQARAVNSAW